MHYLIKKRLEYNSEICTNNKWKNNNIRDQILLGIANCGSSHLLMNVLFCTFYFLQKLLDEQLIFHSYILSKIYPRNKLLKMNLMLKLLFQQSKQLAPGRCPLTIWTSWASWLECWKIRFNMRFILKVGF